MESEREFLQQFINIYHMSPCLWNTKCKEYMNKQLRNDAYDELVKICSEKYPNANREFVIKKIHSLRCCFRRELKKVRGSQRTGTSADDVYVPTLWYYDLLNFIADSEIPRKGRSNLETQDSISKEQDDEDIADEDSESIEDNRLVASPQSATPRPPSSPTVLLQSVSTPSSSRKRPVKQTELLNLASATLQKYNNATKNEADEYSVAGQKYAYDLKMLNSEQRIIAEKLMSDVIFHARLNKLTPQSSIQLQSQEHAFYQNNQYQQQHHFHPTMHTRNDPYYDSSNRQLLSEPSRDELTNYLVFDK